MLPLFSPKAATWIIPTYQKINKQWRKMLTLTRENNWITNYGHCWPWCPTQQQLFLLLLICTIILLLPYMWGIEVMLMVMSSLFPQSENMQLVGLGLLVILTIIATRSQSLCVSHVTDWRLAHGAPCLSSYGTWEWLQCFLSTKERILLSPTFLLFKTLPDCWFGIS